MQKIKDYSLIIKDVSEHNDLTEFILLQEKGLHNFIGSRYTVFEDKKLLIIKTIDGKQITLLDFPKEIIRLFRKDMAKFVIIEVKENSKSGNIFYPKFIRKTRVKTGGRVKQK